MAALAWNSFGFKKPCPHGFGEHDFHAGAATEGRPTVRAEVIIYLRGVAKDQPVEIGVVPEWIQVVIVLCSYTKTRL